MVSLQEPRQNCRQIRDVLEKMGAFVSCQHLIAIYLVQMSKILEHYPALKSIVHEMGLDADNLALA